MNLEPVVGGQPRTSAIQGVLWLALSAASLLWFLMFSKASPFLVAVHDAFFWPSMCFSTALLGGLALLMQRKALGRLFDWRYRFLAIGLIHAVFLYGLSRFGVWILTESFESSAAWVSAIYDTRKQLPPWVIALLLILWVGPMEELFWRGLIQDRFLCRFSPERAFLLTTLVYALVHLPARNPLLILAALILGAHWGYLFLRFRSLWPGLISHGLWDALIFALFPITL